MTKTIKMNRVAILKNLVQLLEYLIESEVNISKMMNIERFKKEVDNILADILD